MRRGRFTSLSAGFRPARALPLAELMLPVVLVFGALAIGGAVALRAPGSAQAITVAGFAAFLIYLGARRLRDLFAKRRAAPAARQAGQADRFVAGFEDSRCGWFWETNAQGAITYVSPSLAETLGRNPGELIGRPFDELLLVEDLERSGTGKPTLGFHLSARFPFAGVAVAPNGRRDLCWSLSGRPDFDEVGRFVGFRGFGLVLSAEQRGEIDSTRLAVTDSLTGLPNRARMRAMLDEALANAASRKEGCGLFLIDLDRFKAVNDTLGHPMGDLLLQEVAQRLAVAIGGEGQIGRLGGDEFEAVLPGIDEEGRLGALAGRLIAAISAPYALRGHAISIGASVGIAISRPGKTYAEALIKEADLALYTAKHAGRGTFRVFEPAMHARASERHILEDDLKRAVANGQMRLAFHPVIDVATDQPSGFEALVRWAHPVRGPLAPADFLPLAEASGAVLEIGEWVIRAACAEASKWPDPIGLCVRASAAQLADSGWAAAVAHALDESGLDPSRLELALAESALVAPGENGRAALATLAELGVRLTLDDFGLGPSTVASLDGVPLNRIRVHPAMLRAALPEDGRAYAVLAAVATFAHGLGMDVAASGLAAREELALVRKLGFAQAQGDLFGPPILPGEALAHLAAAKPQGVPQAARPRPPRQRLIRRGTLVWQGRSFPARIRNISAQGAMVECDAPAPAGAELALDLSAGIRVAAEVRWSELGRVGLRFEEAFDVDRLGKAGRAAPSGILKPAYLDSESSPDSPWAGRSERLTLKGIDPA